MLRILAVLFGICFIFVGVAAFFTAFVSTNGLLFGLFTVNTMANVVHILTGVIAIMAATTTNTSRLFFKCFGIIYLIMAILGFWQEGDLLFMRASTADNILHLILSILALYFGFAL